MPATLTTRAISDRVGSVTIPLTELSSRVVQRYINDYTTGEWDPNNTYNWAPGGYHDFTPTRADSLISYTWRVPTAYFSSTHGISHWKFWVNGVLYYWHSHSGQHLEDGSTFHWEVPSWGTVQARIGYQVRSYSNNSHEIRLYSTNYWNGTGSRQAGCTGQLIIEEIASVGLPQAVGEAGNREFTAR